MVTGPIDVAAFLAPSGRKDPNRRTRIAAEVDGELRGWLHRAARAHANLATCVRLFGSPHKAGGQSLLGEGYAARVARGDRSVLHESITFVRNELDAIREEIEHRMDATPPTHHEPGTPEKVDVMAARLHAGDSLFVEGDAKTNAR
jgi:hypothetical protein